SPPQRLPLLDDAGKLGRRFGREDSRLSVLEDAPSRLWARRVRQCLAWTWLVPLVAVLGSALLLGVGVGALAGTLEVFPHAGVVVMALGFLLPPVVVLLQVALSQPSRKASQYDEFFSDALLEEMLSGENVLDVYTVTTRGASPQDGNVVVFLGGVGGVPETWRPQVEALVDGGFCTIQIQLPGSGCLGAVRFSLPRAAQTVLRVLEQEVFETPDEEGSQNGDEEGILAGMPRSSGTATASTSTSGADSAVGRQAAEDQSANGSASHAHPRKIVLVGWGMAAHVAMYLASSRRLGSRRLAGIALFGTPTLPNMSRTWIDSLYVGAFRVGWIAQLARLAEYAQMSKAVRRTVSLEALSPAARADWGDSFAVWQDGLRLACAEFEGPVLCASGLQSFVSEAELLFGARLALSGSNVEAAVDPLLGKSTLRSFPKVSSGVLVSRLLLEFASSSFI
ncbi:Hypothetical protein SCF082_LOCUS21833, partial [Durusdinium trenchii]